VGDDANPCSRTAPCKTFAGAISKTAPGGEIDALDPGGFGALTITKSITIDGGGGQVASVLVTGVNGIVVAAGATDHVELRNLRIQGVAGNGGNLPNSGQNGVRFLSGKSLQLDHVNISGFANAGVDLSGGAANMRLTINDSAVHDNFGPGVSATSSAFVANQFTRVTITDSHFDNNACGLQVGGPCATPGNGTGMPVLAEAYRSSFTNNTGDGVYAAGTTGYLVLGGDVITSNNKGIDEGGSPAGVVYSFGDNYIASNVTPGAANNSVSRGAKDVRSVVSRAKRASRVIASRHKRHRHHRRH
jgi:hypothetical protein